MQVPLDATHPRPQLQRSHWVSLDGPWEFAIDRDGALRRPSDVAFDRTIEVPFAPETPRSGIAETGSFAACWYRRWVDLDPRHGDERVLLHFGAVDYAASVWIDGARAVEHEGGYTPFSCDITDLIADPGGVEIVVRAYDDPGDLAKPRGKQDWLPKPHAIWYPRTSGIWQTVWYEIVPCARIASLRWGSNLERWEVEIAATIECPRAEPLCLRVHLSRAGVTLVSDEYSVTSGEVHRRIALTDPGIDDSRNDLLWCPESPTLIDAELELIAHGGVVCDRVRSYTALRSFVVDGHRLLLNGRPYRLRLVLDQGYWPDTGLTPPDLEALERDVQLTRAMGFNGVRKHQKVEDPRYLYLADRLGLLVWAEMPSAYRFTTRSVQRLVRQWLEVVERDVSHPCIVAWVPFNESWGVPNLPDSAAERHLVHMLYHATKTLDPSRPVLGNDGWEAVATDIVGIHDYEGNPSLLAARYADGEAIPRLLERERPGGRALVIGLTTTDARPLVLSEFGGLALAGERGRWGYKMLDDAAALERAYTELLAAVHALPHFSGFCYTQLTDTYQESNGLLDAMRRPKFAIDRIAAATRGERTTPDVEDVMRRRT